MSERAMFVYCEVPSFYAAIERVDDPSLRATPVIVGGDPNKQGKVQSASPDALAQGVRTGMLVNDALDLCDRARLVRTDLKRYRVVSQLLFQSLRGVSPELEPAGLSGAYCVVEGDQADNVSVATLAREMAAAVRQVLSLPLRVGAARQKFLARLAAEDVEGEGFSLIDATGEAAYLSSLSPGRLPQVGPKTTAVLRDLGVRSVADLLDRSPEELERELGNHGRRILALARGEEASGIAPAGHAKSLTHESRFEAPELARPVVEDRLREVCQNVEGGLRQQGLEAGCVALKLRYDDRTLTTRSRKLPRPVASANEIYAAAQRLLDRTECGSRPVQTIGVALSALNPQAAREDQLDLFPVGD